MSDNEESVANLDDQDEQQDPDEVPAEEVEPEEPRSII